jgi:hypothetical protein
VSPKHGKRKRGQTQRSTRLPGHKRVGGKLVPPLAELPLSLTSYACDVLPELLLIDAAVDQLTWSHAPNALHAVCDALDPLVPPDSKEVCTGMITSMALIPENHRAEARRVLLENHLDEVILPEGLRHGLALYPNCPAAWLLADWREVSSIDWETGIRYLKGAVRRLYDSRGVYSTRCRMMPIARMAKAGKLLFSADLPTLDLLPRYPTGLTEDEQKQVEAWSRACFGGIQACMPNATHDWPEYFWRHNYEISACEREDPYTGGSPVDHDTVAKMQDVIRGAVECLGEHVERVAQQVRLDLYDPDRDEVLFGILSRQYWLFGRFASDPRLWTPAVGGMFLRAMVDLAINMRWLVQRNDRSLFGRFKEFSLGKQKLLKMQIEDLVEEGRQELEVLGEYLSEVINEETWEEFISVDLGGNFAGKNAYQMAKEVGLKDMYDLVYSPGSSQLHGEWTYLKTLHLVRCVNPLHRFHRLPYLNPPSLLSPNALTTAGDILVTTLRAWLSAYDTAADERVIDQFVSAIRSVYGESDGHEADQCEAGGSVA